MPPNRSIEWSFTKKVSFYGLFCGLQICEKCIGGWGSSRRPPVPDFLVGWGGGHQSQCPTHLGALIFVPSPWKPGAPADLELDTDLLMTIGRYASNESDAA